MRIAKTLMDASGHAHLIMCDEALRRKSLLTVGAPYIHIYKPTLAITYIPSLPVGGRLD